MVDFNLQEGDAVITGDVAILLQQINILFDTTPGDLMGDMEFGTDYQHFLYDLKMSASQLENAVMNDLKTIDMMGFTPEVKAYLMQGTERDIALIRIDLYKTGENYTKIYSIR